MAREVRSFTVTVPAGTAADDPQITDLTMPPRVVTEIEIVVPPGPAGNVGFAIGSAGTAIVPWNPDEWIITDNEVIRWPLDGFHDSGAWQCLAYNTGTLDHSIYIRFLLDLVAAAPSNPPYVSAAAIETPAS